MTRLQRNKEITGAAKEIFMRTLYTRREEQVTDRKVVYLAAVEPQITDAISNIISDNGIMLLSTWEDWAKIWADLRENNEEALISILHMASIFRATAFESDQDYNSWVTHIGTSLGAHTSSSNGQEITVITSNANLPSTVDDDLLQRLPRKDIITKLLSSNVWITYLATLALVYHEVYNEILETVPLTEIIKLVDARRSK